MLRTWGNAATLATADVADELADARRSLARRNCAEASEGGRLSKGPRLRAETPHSGVQARALPVGLQSFLLVTLIMDPPSATEASADARQRSSGWAPKTLPTGRQARGMTIRNILGVLNGN